MYLIFTFSFITYLYLFTFGTCCSKLLLYCALPDPSPHCPLVFGFKIDFTTQKREKKGLKKIQIFLTYVKIPYLEDFDFLRKSYRTEVLTISSQEKQKSFYKCYNIKITFLSPFFAKIWLRIWLRIMGQMRDFSLEVLKVGKKIGKNRSKIRLCS